jgi:hypothetical protein
MMVAQLPSSTRRCTRRRVLCLVSAALCLALAACGQLTGILVAEATLHNERGTQAG